MLRDIVAVKAANKAAGYYSFSPATLRGFRSRVSENVYSTPDGAVIVTSERDTGMWINGEFGAAWDGKRRYTVRFVSDDGKLDSISGHGEYASYSGAHKRAEREQKARIEANQS